MSTTQLLIVTAVLEAGAGLALLCCPSATLVLYNLGTVLILAAAGIWSPPVGVGLWPVVVLHAAMAVWCIKSLRTESA